MPDPSFVSVPTCSTPGTRPWSASLGHSAPPTRPFALKAANVYDRITGRTPGRVTRRETPGPRPWELRRRLRLRRHEVVPDDVEKIRRAVARISQVVPRLAFVKAP